MKVFEYTVKDELGIHARPAGILVKRLASVKSSVSIECKAKGTKADAKRLMAVMKMAVKQGDTVTITVDGEDEETAAVEIEQFFKDNF